MPVETLLLWALTLAAAAVFVARFVRLLVPVLKGPPDPRTDRPADRWRGVFEAIGLHRRLLNLQPAGIIHALVFVSFWVLLTSIIEAFGSGLVPGFTLAPLGGNTWIALLQDLFGVIMLLGLGMAVHQRFVTRPPRFEGSNATDATIIYVLIAAIVVSMLGEAAAAIVADAGENASWRPVSRVLAELLTVAGVSPQVAALWESLAYWVHVGAILVFLVYIPGSKHRHMFLAGPNVYLRSLEPRGQQPAPPADENAVNSIERFTWKHRYDTLACTECGRCQAACPAYAAGQPLSPKKLIMALRDNMIGVDGADGGAPLAGEVIAPETLWACTTCSACMEVCPVHIEHVPKIVDLRRELVDSGVMPELLQEALLNVQQSGNSQGKAARTRARWTKGLSFKPKDARKEPVDVLWFVGDFASYDPRVQEVTRRIAEILHAGGVDFGLLYEAEQNSGNDVRRAGEEGLFEMLAMQNIEAIDGCDYRRIMTSDPHSLNALANEYRSLGKDYLVHHYAEIVRELVHTGALTPLPPSGAPAATYHDPCYLGRYNRQFDAPRELVALAGYRLAEMPRNKENSFCCGAGGGRIWGDDTGVVERPSENRIREALSLGDDVSVFAVSCPKDKVMYTAAVQALGVEDRLAVRDLSEILRFEQVDAIADPT